MKKIGSVLLLPLLMACLSMPASADTLRVDFYDMGKADAMLITTPKGRRVLIDAATNKGGKALADRFAADGVDRIDLLVVTHFDKDHVGGADQILEDIPVGTVVIPTYEKDGKQYEQFVEALAQANGTTLQRLPIAGSAAFDLDGVRMTVTAAHRAFYGEDEENDFSLAVRAVYGDTRFLFAGDAEAARQMELLEEGDVACDVLKTPYHGRMTAASEAFLTAARPKIAFVTDSDEEPANEQLLSILRGLGTDVRCARDGAIAVLSDGAKVWVE